mmetsp:Transcript_4789/g.14977  ORF Transcript_4789/g.14977 Transcript_4789/m.14977 type:complete len:102 (-) Transcript_4789:380-685(-)
MPSLRGFYALLDYSAAQLRGQCFPWLSGNQVLRLWSTLRGDDVEFEDVCAIDEALIQIAEDYAAARDARVSMSKSKVLVVNTARHNTSGEHWFARIYYIAV